jgi:hypothetical protein
VEYLEEIDSVVAGSIEEALILSAALQELLLGHKSIDGSDSFHVCFEEISL